MRDAHNFENSYKIYISNFDHISVNNQSLVIIQGILSALEHFLTVGVMVNLPEFKMSTKKKRIVDTIITFATTSILIFV